jgi:hypothetical protein
VLVFFDLGEGMNRFYPFAAVASRKTRRDAPSQAKGKEKITNRFSSACQSGAEEK